MVERLFSRKQLAAQVDDYNGGDNGSKGVSKVASTNDQATKDENNDNQRLDLAKVNVFKSNLIRFMPPKIQCRRILRDEEKLFIKGLEHYYKRINLGNFFGTVEKLRLDMETIKKKLGTPDGQENEFLPTYSLGSPNTKGSIFQPINPVTLNVEEENRLEQT